MIRTAMLFALSSLVGTTAHGAIQYVISTDTSLFDQSSMTQGNGSTLGTIAVGCNNHAALFTPGGTTVDLGDELELYPPSNPADFPCNHQNDPVAVNNSGVVVGKAAFNSGVQSQAYGGGAHWVWTPQNGMTQVLPFPVGLLDPSINDAGTVVGTTLYPRPPTGCAIEASTGPDLSGYIWTAGSGLTLLSDVTDLGGFQCIYAATKINNKGQILALAILPLQPGSGMETNVVLLPVPIPPVAFLLASAVAALGWVRRSSQQKQRYSL